MLGADKNTDEGFICETIIFFDKIVALGRRFLKSRSPLYFASRVKNPLLIIHGANDPRVKQSESGNHKLSSTSLKPRKFGNYETSDWDFASRFLNII